MTQNTLFVSIALVFSLFSGWAQPMDTLILGDSTSEKAHAFRAPEGASIVTNRARVILPPRDKNWQGGKIEFQMAVDPKRQNYFTARFLNSEVNQNLLFLFVEGKQIGYRPLGDYDMLCGPNVEPLAREGYFYQTLPLPRKLTEGKTSVHLAIGATGWIWPYGTTFELYQREMVSPSRGILEVQTSLDAGDVLPAQPSGSKYEWPRRPPLPETPEQIVSQVKERLNKDIQSLLNRKPGSCNQMQLHLLAKAYHVPWTRAFNTKKVLDHVTSGIDAHFIRYRKDPVLLTNDTSTWNPSWYCFGVLGECLVLLEKELVAELDSPITDEKGATVSRRAAWSELLLASVNYLRTHRRQYTNQSMIADLNLYRANRGLRILDASKALPEQDARAYLYEATGILPWLGSDDATGKRTRPLGDNFFQLTEQGLTRELGYVGGYGEVQDWVVQIYDATRESRHGKGDPRIKEQLTRIAKARAFFRYPAPDKEGYQAMRMETVIGWRDIGLLGPVVYGAKSARDASSIAPAAVSQDPWSVGYAQQMLADHQFFQGVKEHLHEGGLRETLGLLDLPEDYAWLAAQPLSPYRLPMTPNGPDILFADLDDGVIAIKHGRVILYVSLYWRALYGINNLAKIHYIAPGKDVRATVVQHTEFIPSGKMYKRPSNSDAGYGRGPYKQYREIPSAHEGEELPIAQIPPEIAGSYKVGLGNLFAGRGSFYQIAYGPYIMVMNCSKEAPRVLQLPDGKYRELPSGKTAASVQQIEPRATKVFVKE